LQHRSEETGVNRFAFVVHPLSVDFIHQHPHYRWSRLLPDGLVEAIGAFFPPLYLGRTRGGQSPATGQRIEGYLYTLGATPRQMLRHSPGFTYARLRLAARMAARRGARLMGLGAFTSVIGDGGISVARQANIAITSGNSLTIAVTLETAKQALLQMGAGELARSRAMVIGASGAIGSACARLLAREAGSLVLVSKDARRLHEVQQRILAEMPQAQVETGTQANDLLGDCDLVITATSATGQRVLDITRCKPGAVICDVARPPDVSAAEAALRPDVLVIESGEVVVPGEVDFGYDMGLPTNTAYACLAETMLLAMEGRFENYTLGRDISLERVGEIYALFQKHRFQLAGLRSFGEPVSEEALAHKRALADKPRAGDFY
jgi:predicted amino acid dehydrogenase